MPRVAPIQSSFTGGEYSPLVYGRVDAERYKLGLARCLNYVPILQGPLARRPGTKYVAPTKSAGASAPLLVRFEFSTTQAYIIEFGNLYARFYRNNSAITETAKVITGITQANPAVVTSNAHGFSNGDEVEVAAIVGMTELNARRFTVAGVTANTFQLSGINSTGYGAYASGGTAARVYTVVTPYVTADLFQLKFAQSADVLYIAHPGYQPRKLSRTAHTSWTLTVIPFLDGPYLPTNVETTTLTPSAATGAGITLTASAVTGINGGQGFLATDVGRMIRLREGTTWGYVTITARNSPTEVIADVIKTLTNTNAKVNWRLGVWSSTTGYPAAVTFHEDRLFFGGATSYPQRFDGSNTGDYENYAPSALDGTVGDANGVAFTLNATDVNVIRWMRSEERGMIVGTVGAEWIVRPSAQNEALTPTNVSAKPSTKHGSANIEPVQAGKATLFLQRAKRKIRELTYLFEVDGFRAPDTTLLAEHVTKGGVIQLAYQQEPFSLVWAARTDGYLLGMTYERDLESLKIGWHRHALGGRGTSGGAAPVVESIAVIPSSDGTRDELWMVVKRYINGQTVRYIEYMTKFFEEDDATEDAFHVDCGATYDSTSTTTISGLWHLEGETVYIWADGATQPNKVVASGRITLDRAASVVQVGYTYNSDGQLLRIEAGAADGTAQGKIKRINKVGFMLYRTLGLKFGRDFDNLDTISFRTTGNAMGAAVPLFSGIKSETFDGDYDMDGQVCWRQDTPAPGIILAIMPQLVEQDAG